MKICIIIVAGSQKQNKCFWPTYKKINAGLTHDLIVVHRNEKFLPASIENKYGNIIFENKINKNGYELENKAFGAYRNYFNIYKEKYDCFAFISDDVLIKRNNWLLDAVEMLFSYDKLGFVGAQIFNGDLKQYPHPSHCRAPIWFGKTKALKNINWVFCSDHEGEMRIADQFLEAGYFGAQIGNKIDLAYDATEKGKFFEGDHVASLMAKKLGLDIYKPIDENLRNQINKQLLIKLKNNDDSLFINSPFFHIGRRQIISQLQPFSGLIYDKSIELCKNNIEINNFGINILI